MSTSENVRSYIAGWDDCCRQLLDMLSTVSDA